MARYTKADISNPNYGSKTDTTNFINLNAIPVDGESLPPAIPARIPNYTTSTHQEQFSHFTAIPPPPLSHPSASTVAAPRQQVFIYIYSIVTGMQIK